MTGRRLRHALGLAVVPCAWLAMPPRAVAVDPNFQICAADFPLSPPLQRVVFALNAGFNARLTDLTAEHYTDAAALEAGTTWDFSPATGSERILQMAPVTDVWSCSVSGGCASRIALSDVLLIDDDVASGNRDVNGLDYDGGGRLLLRAQVSEEGGAGELRVCFEADVDFLRFARAGNCLAGGDPDWSSNLDCDWSVRNNDPCGGAGPIAGLTGAITGRAVQNGTLRLPSGHVLDAVLVETYASFTAALTLLFDCDFDIDEIHQYLLQWLVPHYGPVVQLSSPGGDSDLSWQTVGSTTIGYGLLPPLAIQVDATTDTSITVSWDPGRMGTYAPDHFFVHWGETAGSPTTSSEDVGDEIPGTQLSYTVSNLQPDTSYCISVSSGRTYVDPYSRIPVPYRSIELPDSIGADIDGDGNRDVSYPPEVCARTQAGSGPVPLLRRVGKVGLPLVNPRDLYVPSFTPGQLEPDVSVVSDTGRPLIFYGYDGARTLRAVKTADLPPRMRIY